MYILESNIPMKPPFKEIDLSDDRKFSYYNGYEIIPGVSLRNMVRDPFINEKYEQFFTNMLIQLSTGGDNAQRFKENLSEEFLTARR